MCEREGERVRETETETEKERERKREKAYEMVIEKQQSSRSLLNHETLSCGPRVRWRSRGGKEAHKEINLKI